VNYHFLKLKMPAITFNLHKKNSTYRVRRFNGSSNPRTKEAQLNKHITQIPIGKANVKNQQTIHSISFPKTNDL
jgi:hypothetical protein